MPRGEKLGDRLFRVGLEVLHAHRTPPPGGGSDGDSMYKKKFYVKKYMFI